MAFIELRNIQKSFGPRHVLDGVSLTIERGESVVVIGQSGTGKSVLLKHLLRLLEPDAGEVYVDGADVLALHRDELAVYRKRFGMLFQSAALFDSLTVAENVGFGLVESRDFTEDEINRRVEEMLALVGLPLIGEAFPSQLSGGMRKRVGLARAIATGPEVLLYDEPTTGLDPVTSELINDLIVELNNRLHVTSIVVTHDMRSAFKIADRIVFLHQGKIVFNGTPAEVKASVDPLLKQFVYGRSEGPMQLS